MDKIATKFNWNNKDPNRKFMKVHNYGPLNMLRKISYSVLIIKIK